MNEKPIIVLGTGAGNVRFLSGEVGPAPVPKPVHAPPAQYGPHGKAWLCDLKAARRKHGVTPEQDATLDHWLIEAAWAHPIWHSYSLVLVHLRPLADGRKTLFYLPDATHEIWLYALDPEADREKAIADGTALGSWLAPKNFAAQFIEITDDLARERVRAAVQKICDGKLSPDTDYTSQWAALFGDNMLKERPGRRPPVER